MTEDTPRSVDDNHGTAKSLSDRRLFVPGETAPLRLEDVLSDPEGETLFLPSGIRALGSLSTGQLSNRGAMKMAKRSALILVFLICSSFSERSYADSEAQELAKMVGSVTGMANICGYTVTEDWLAASTKAIKDISRTSGDLGAAQKLRDEYMRAASTQQKSQPQMNCADVLRSLGDFERKLLK